jgi:hypothetical protein
MMLAVLPWNSPVMPELRKMTASAPLVQLAAAWEELHPAICMIFRRSKGAVAVRETTPASAPLTKISVADPPEPSLSLNAVILAVGNSDPAGQRLRTDSQLTGRFVRSDACLRKGQLNRHTDEYEQENYREGHT